MVSNEGGSFGLFAEQGFKLIPIAIEIVNNHSDYELLITALSLLLTCIERSNTTEIPNKLLQYWTSINNKVREGNVKDGMKIWSEINRWYRIDKHYL